MGAPASLFPESGDPLLAVVLPPEEAGLLAGAEPEVVEPALAGPEVGVLAGLAVAELAGLADDVEAETGRLLTEDSILILLLFPFICKRIQKAFLFL